MVSIVVTTAYPLNPLVSSYISMTHRMEKYLLYYKTKCKIHAQRYKLQSIGYSVRLVETGYHGLN